MICVLVMIDRFYPVDHSFLVDVLEKRVLTKNYKGVWLLRCRTSCVWFERRDWLNSEVFLLPYPNRTDPLSLAWFYLNFLIRLPLFFYRNPKVRPGLIFVRNDPVFYWVAIFMKFVLRSPIVFQVSHLKEEEIESSIAKWSFDGVAKYVKLSASRFLRNRALSRSDLVVCVSERMLEVLKKSIKSTDYVVFPLGVDPDWAVGWVEDSSSLMIEMRSSRKVFLYVGTLAQSRRIDVTISAFKEFVGRVDKPDDYCLYVVGGGDADISRLKRVTLNLGVEKQVVFIGHVSRDELREYLRASFVCLSVIPPTKVFSTISPTKLMEYMAFGKPVIGTRGIREQETIIANSGGGLLVDFDVSSVSEAMLELALCPSNSRDMGRRGREYILECRNYDRMSAMLNNSIAKLLN